MGEGAQAEESSEHLNTDPLPKGTTNVVLGTIGLQPGSYEIQVHVLDPKSRRSVTHDPAPIYVSIAGEVQRSDDRGNFYDPRSTPRAATCGPRSPKSSTSGRPSTGTTSTPSISSAPSSLPTRTASRTASPSTWTPSSTVRTTGGAGQREALGPAPVPEGAWEAYHRITLMLHPSSEWDLELDIGWDFYANESIGNKVQFTLDWQGDVVFLTSY